MSWNKLWRCRRQSSLLVERLLESLPDGVDEVSDEEFAAELDRRWAEIEQGIEKPVPWSAIKLEG
jgi:putative addiction module component (TIGR02574 family)